MMFKAHTLILDPGNHYGAQDLKEPCGLLYPWVLDSLLSDPEEVSLADGLSSRYAFFNGWDGLNPKASVDPVSGRYDYPDDPPLYPYLRFNKDDEDLFIYPYGIVIAKKDGKWVTSRMD